MGEMTAEDELFSRARKTMRGARENEFALLDVVAEFASADLRGYPSTERLLEDLWRIDRRDARRLVRHAGALLPRVSLTGQPLPARAPATAAGCADGEVSPAHVEVVLDALDRLDRTPHLAPEVVADAEATLAEAARVLAPRGLRRVAARLLDTLDPDGAAPADEPEPDDELHLGRGRDGSVTGSFRIHTPADRDLLGEAFDALSGPAGPDDTRSLERRRAEAFLDLLAQAVSPTGIAHPADPDSADASAAVEPAADGSDVLAQGAGAEPEPADRLPLRVLGRGTLTVTMPLDWLQARTGHARLDSEEAITAAAARRIACDAGVVPMVLGTRGQPLDVGRLSYVVPEGMRRALIHRDGGCAFPGCTRRPGRCASHHIRHWADGGPTALDNLALLCRYHHHLIHHDQWTIRMHDGRPWFVPPEWLDPDRTPRPGGRHPVA